MSKEMLTEIRKLEARLEEFLKAEELFVKELRGCLETFKKLDKDMMQIKFGSRNIDELMKLKLEAVKALSEALHKESKAEHEKSHLLESYGSLIQVLEETFQKES